MTDTYLGIQKVWVIESESQVVEIESTGTKVVRPSSTGEYDLISLDMSDWPNLSNIWFSFAWNQLRPQRKQLTSARGIKGWASSSSDQDLSMAVLAQLFWVSSNPGVQSHTDTWQCRRFSCLAGNFFRSDESWAKDWPNPNLFYLHGWRMLVVSTCPLVWGCLVNHD